MSACLIYRSLVISTRNDTRAKDKCDRGGTAEKERVRLGIFFVLESNCTYVDAFRRFRWLRFNRLRFDPSIVRNLVSREDRRTYVLGRERIEKFRRGRARKSEGRRVFTEHRILRGDNKSAKDKATSRGRNSEIGIDEVDRCLSRLLSRCSRKKSPLV